ncbi:MAG TPA: phosphoadenosine phosphosulfate reductase family protein [Gemmatimonadales bacterium]
MKIFLQENVLEAALARMHRIFDEFPEIIVNFSGGKDSTVTLNLALQVAEARGRLPLHVLWLDQEAEWENVVSYVRQVMNDPRVSPLWFQGPFRIFNATSGTDPWLDCWKPGAEWIRPKEPNSIHINGTGTDRFTELFEAFSRWRFGTAPRAHLAGVRAEESPARLRGLTSYATFKDITWGSAAGRKDGQFTFYPLYDWSYTDVWKAIHEHGWPYCRLYDYMYQYGLPVHRMRVSNVHHETAVESLRFLQEIEPITWDRIVERVQGVNAVSQARETYQVPKELPWMFTSWREYRDHLLANLIEPEVRPIFAKQFASWDAQFEPEAEEALTHMEIAAMLVNDYHGTKYTTFVAAHGRFLKGRGRRGRVKQGAA